MADIMMNGDNADDDQYHHVKWEKYGQSWDNFQARREGAPLSQPKKKTKNGTFS